MSAKSIQTIIPLLGDLSFDRLAEFAVEEKLIDRVEVHGNEVAIVKDEMRFRLPQGQASTFLVGMLRGRSWYLEDPPSDDHGQGGAATLTSSPVSTADDVDDSLATRCLEATLEALLTLAKDLGIIRDYRKDAEERIVHVDIAACSSSFSYVDAVGYLLDCVQHTIRISAEHSRGSSSGMNGPGLDAVRTSPDPTTQHREMH